MVIDKQTIIDVVHRERLKILNSTIEEQRKTIRTSRTCYWVMTMILLLTWLSGLFFIWTGKIPIIGCGGTQEEKRVIR